MNRLSRIVFVVTCSILLAGCFGKTSPKTSPVPPPEQDTIKVTMTPTVREVRVLKSIVFQPTSVVLREKAYGTIQVTVRGTGDLDGRTWLEGPAGTIGTTPLRYIPDKDRYVADVRLSQDQIPQGKDGRYKVKAVLIAEGQEVTSEVTASGAVRLILEVFPIALKSQVEAYTAYFNSDDDTLQTQYRAKVEEFASLLERHASLIQAIRVTGHCDLRGTEDYNDTLGERRAESIATVLADRLPGVTIKTESLGKRNPNPQGDSPDNLARNRWATIELLIN